MATTLETQAKLRYLRMSPRKVRLLVDLIRGMKATAALQELQFSKKTGARPVAKLLQSAIANAKHNHDLDEASLVVTKGFVDGGPILYRAMPRAMGRSAPIRKRTAHITLVLSGTPTVGAMKEEKKETETKETEVQAEMKKEEAVKPKKEKAVKKVAKKSQA